MLGLSNFGIHAFADRFTYLPAIGFSMVLAGLLHRVAAQRRFGWWCGGLCGVALCFGVMADRQARYWKDEGALFKHTLAVDGEGNAFMRGLFGLHLYEFEGDLANARAHMDFAFARVRARELESIRGAYVEVLAESGDIQRARDEMRRYLEIREEDSRQVRERLERQHGTALTDKMGYLMYAIVNLAEGNLDIAKSHVDAFDRLLPGVAHTSYLRGKITLAEGDPAAAIRHWKRSLSDTRAYIRHRFVEKRILELEPPAATSSARP
jgi:tetratricopeptide (TPR) repeat protein